MCCSVVDQPENSPMNLAAGLVNGQDLPAELSIGTRRVEQGAVLAGFLA
jgi:hypothetical protein